ncbi:MAG TPA: hypothetical protein VGO78_18915 [Acidimicrobiales bacterium]|nr:hypothetical protein [Acidimicrobiales bacterium]
MALLGLASLGLVIWTVIDAVSHPDWAWQQSGQNKGLWIALPIVLLILCGIVGGILALVYLLSIRPQVMAAEGSGGGTYGGYGGPPPGSYGGPPPGPYGGPPPGPSGPYGAPPGAPPGPFGGPPPGGPAAPPPPPPPPADPFGS